MTALADALAAAEHSGVVIQSVELPAEQDAAREVFDAVWPGEGTQVTPNLLRAITYSGGYASVAYASGVPIGAALAIVGVRNSVTLLHSHMAAVLEGERDRHIGTALKLHQRWWALEHGYSAIGWTFDPLVRRNAKLNLVKLGTEVIGYEENFYGGMLDAINAGDHSDRLYVWWELDSSKVQAAASGNPEVFNARELRAEGFEDALLNEDGYPRVIDTSAHALLVAVPADIVEIRNTNRDLALAWRLAMREVLQQRLMSHWKIIGLTDDDRYVLTKGI